MPFPSKDLSDLAEQFFKPSAGTDLSDAGPASRRLRDTVTLNEDRTRPFVATVFWQAFLESPAIEIFRSIIDAQLPAHTVRLMQVVPQTATWPPRFDLLLLLDGVRDLDLYISGEALCSEDDLRQGSRRFLEKLAAAGGDFQVLGDIEHAELAIEAFRSAPFGILAFPAPPMLPTASVANSSILVTEPSTQATSTVGVRCMNNMGIDGVTVAWHAVKDTVSGDVDVAGVTGTVVSHDLLSDSAFVDVVPPGYSWSAARPQTLTPRQHEAVSFRGSKSGSRPGKVTGWSPQLPTVTGNSQLVVTTDPISRPGDSGAALLDSQGMLLGFCHETSQIGAVNPYSSWIWADSVFKAHNLK